jgi:hypothetical protein
MSASNYPPGMTRRDYDHVEGIIRCENCGADITKALEDSDHPEASVCPGGCPERDWDRVRDEREGY